MALPSFVQLMASLGLSDPSEQGPIKSVPSRSLSTPALRETAARQYSSRYSPYSPLLSSSLSSDSSLSDPESSPKVHSFRRSLHPRKYRHRVTRSDSSSDIAGDTPISTYVRRKTPGSSPITPNFDSGYESGPSHQTPFSIPTLPVLLTNSASSDPESPTSDFDGQIAKDQDYYRFILLQRTGTRISAARAARRQQIAQRYALPN